MKIEVDKKNSKVYIAGSMVVATVMVLAFLFDYYDNSVPHRNTVDTKISLYSGREITPNAITTNSEFETLTFDTSTPKQSIFLSSMAAVVRTIKSLTTEPASEEPSEYGSWVWTPTKYLTPEYVESILSGANERGVNTIYLSIDSYLDIFVMPDGEEKERQKEIFSEKLSHFIERANHYGMEVDAEAGWQNWAEEGHTYKPFAILSFVKNFNETQEYKFRGFQYDVEPYILDSYEENKAPILKNFVKLIDDTEYFLASSPLRFSVVVPDFFDGDDKLTPKFSYNGSRNYVFKHLLNILDRRPHSSIIVMSYRNYADGPDGSIEVSKNEMRTADRGGYKTKIIIAQETSEVPPPYITFHDTPKKYFNWQVEKINDEFGSHPNFGGIAIHFINTFLTMR